MADFLPEDAATGDLFTLDFQEVYGERWEEYSIQCPYVSAESKARQLGIEVKDAEDLSAVPTGQFIYLRNEEELSVHHARSKEPELCSRQNLNDVDFVGWIPASETLILTWDDGGGRWVIA
ncbi:hypothetical protein [Corynebacterium urogenitale]|uniref:hypothetical protein n=1 Tax=Corynebacterium urogenitale TaxID=2487892 RepID=UPI00125EDE7C|nr:hypothetical protein [Corynebacterium urogenitale]